MLRPLLSLILLLVSLPALAFPVTVTDARGVRVTERAAPRRIISLTPAITEMLFALGLGSRVVGDTVYGDYPPAARRVAKIGDVRVNYERVVALRPDLVVGDAVATSSAIARLGQLRLPVFAVRPDTVDGVERDVRQLGQVTARPIRRSSSSRAWRRSGGRRGRWRPRVRAAHGFSSWSGPTRSLWRGGGHSWAIYSRRPGA